MLVAANITQQFGAKPLFENVNAKFGEGNRYGLIGANGAGKSTLMKILCGALDPSAGNVSKEKHERMAYLRQDQFAYEDQRVLDVVLMGHAEMWACMSERDAIYANPEATEDDYMHAAELESKFAEYDGYTAEARAGELLLGVGQPYNKLPATYGNGTMVALQMPSKEKVHEVYDAAMKAGAIDEGPAGPRGDTFYAGYYRDLDGNKLCAFYAPGM